MHVVGLSGGDDSTLLSVLLAEKEPRPYNYICTPTGNELPEMFEHWKKLGDILGKPILPIMHHTGLMGVIREQRMIPNFRARFCTRILKIEPYRKFLMEQSALGPVVSYIGLRADGLAGLAEHMTIYRVLRCGSRSGSGAIVTKWCWRSLPSEE